MNIWWKKIMGILNIWILLDIYNGISSFISENEKKNRNFEEKNT